MKSLRQLSAISWLVVLAGGTAFAPLSLAQSDKWPLKEIKSDPPCPTFSVSCPSHVKDGEPMTFTASISVDVGTPLTYTWTVYGGTIIQGQGTPSIKVKGSRPFTASLTIGGLNPACPSAASCSLIPGTPPPPIMKSDSYGILPIKEEKAKLDSFAAVLKDQPGAMGYILSYGARRGSARAARAAGERAKAYLVKEQGIDNQQIVTVEGGFKEKLTVDLWIVPTGAIPPKPEPAADPGASNRLSDRCLKRHVRH